MLRLIPGVTLLFLVAVDVRAQEPLRVAGIP